MVFCCSTDYTVCEVFVPFPTKKTYVYACVAMLTDSIAKHSCVYCLSFTYTVGSATYND